MQQFNTERGAVVVKVAQSVEEILAYTLDDGLGFFWHNRPDLQRDALVKIAAQPAGRVVIAIGGGRIIGYVTITLPDEDERWGRDRIAKLYELGGIEVGRNWRGLGLSRALLSEAFADGTYDEAIVLATGYRWCWDYEWSGLSVRQYREVLHKTMRRFGFEQFDTDEPNIAWYPENALVARMGRRAPKELVAKFKALLFENLGSDYAFSEFVGR
jgi:acetoin utilization protein AcuA